MIPCFAILTHFQMIFIRKYCIRLQQEEQRLKTFFFCLDLVWGGRCDQSS